MNIINPIRVNCKYKKIEDAGTSPIGNRIAPVREPAFS